MHSQHDAGSKEQWSICTSRCRFYIILSPTRQSAKHRLLVTSKMRLPVRQPPRCVLTTTSLASNQGCQRHRMPVASFKLNFVFTDVSTPYFIQIQGRFSRYRQLAAHVCALIEDTLILIHPAPTSAQDVNHPGEERTVALVARVADSYEALRSTLSSETQDAGKGAPSVRRRDRTPCLHPAESPRLSVFVLCVLVNVVFFRAQMEAAGSDVTSFAWCRHVLLPRQGPAGDVPDLRAAGAA